MYLDVFCMGLCYGYGGYGLLLYYYMLYIIVICCIFISGIWWWDWIYVDVFVFVGVDVMGCFF